MSARDKRLTAVLAEHAAWRDRRRKAEAQMRADPTAETARAVLLAKADEQEYTRDGKAWAVAYRQLAKSGEYCAAHAAAAKAEEHRKRLATAITGIEP